MSLLILPETRATQPNRPTNLVKDIRHDFVWVAGTGERAVTGHGITNSCTKQRGAVASITSGYAVIAKPVKAIYSSNFSLICQVRPQSGLTVFIGSRPTGFSIYLNTADNTLSMTAWGVTDIRWSYTVPTNRFVTVVIVKKGSSNRAWVDGAYLGEVVNASSPVADNGTQASIGSASGSGGFKGTYPLSSGAIALLATFPQSISYIYARNISRNPWQIFEPESRVYFVNSVGGTPSVTASGNIYSVDISAPNVSANATAITSVSASNLSLTAPNATVITVSISIASGSIAATTLIAPSSNAITNVSASGIIDSIDLSAPNATATTVGTAIASGNIDSIDLSAPNVSVVGVSSVVGVGSLQPIDLSAPNISAVAVVMGSGNFTGITLTAPAAVQAIPTVIGTGVIASMMLTAPTVVQAPSTTVPEIVNFIFDLNTEFSLPFNIETEFNLAQNLNKEHTFEPFKIVEMSR
jgi:hypothetical protein